MIPEHNGGQKNHNLLLQKSFLAQTKGQINSNAQKEKGSLLFLKDKGDGKSRKQLSVGLSQKKQSNDLSYYIYHQRYAANEQISNQISQQILEEARQDKLASMDENPEQYFNFGFDREAFQTYMMLLILRRSQRQNLYNNLQEVYAHLRRTISNKQFSKSDIPKFNFNPFYRQ